MYRQTSLRVPCTVCGVEESLPRMELSPRGGHWCWRCQMSAQVAAHETTTKSRLGARNVAIVVGATLSAVAVFYFGMVALYVLFGHCC